MRPLRLLSLSVLAIASLVVTAAAQQYAPAIRIVNHIDETQLVTLKGNTHPAATAKNDRGRVSDSLPMTDLILVLSRDAAQQAAFEKFVASQYDSTSPNFHQWLTPKQVGENFGPSETDIATVTQWLTGHGFTVSQVTKDRMSIRFSGTAGLVQSVFHTEIHNLEVKGEQHIGNMSDPQIPSALAPVVVGVKSLHNFFPRPLHRMGSQVQRDAATGKWKRTPNSPQAGSVAKTSVATKGARPLFGINVPESSENVPYTVEDVTPWDFAAIYNVTPLWNAGIDGSGQTIAIAGTSEISLNDVATFRTFFDLPTTNAANTPILMSGNSQPLTICASESNTALCGLDDLIENSLDVEWSGSIAKNAQIVLVSSYPASSSDDNLYDSESYIVDNLTARIMNVSYGVCELGNGTAGNVEYYDLWQTAAAEGIAVFVAAGDSGAASCDDGGDQIGYPYSAQLGVTVSGLASTPYNTAVGGTDFNWCPQTTIYTAQTTSGTEPTCPAAPYWSATSNSTTKASAIGYLPEVPWNDTCSSPLALGYLEDWATLVSYSGIKDAETACNFIQNDWLNAANSEGIVLAPYLDTVGGSGGASGCVANSGGPNNYSAIYGTPTGTCTSGATSTGTTTNPDTSAAQASIPLFNDGWIKPSWQTGVNGIPPDGVRDIPDVSFFSSDGLLSESAYLICVYDNGALGYPQCTYANDAEPFASEVGGTSASTPAMAGVMALINQKAGAAQGSPNAELYKLAATQTYSSCSAERGSGSPVTSGACMFNDIDTGTIAMACDNGAAEGGVYYDTATGQYEPENTEPGIVSANCTVLYSGDTVGIQSGYSATTGYDQASGLGSLNVANVVNAWPASLGTSAATVTVTPAANTVSSSQSLNVTVTVSSSTPGLTTPPTGTVTLSSGSYTSSGTLNSSGSYTFTIPGGSLSVGPDTLTAAYSGDSLYAVASGNTSVIVTAAALLTPIVTVSPASSTLNSDASLSVPVTVSGTGQTPTGMVTLSSGSYNSGELPLVGGAYTFTIPANSLASGATPTKDVLTVTYSGDANYGTASGTSTVTVTESTFTLTSSATTAIAPGAQATETITVATTTGYAGTITLTCQETSFSGGTPTDAPSCDAVGGGASVILASNATSGTAQFSVLTTAPTTSALTYPQIHGNGRGWVGAGGGAVLALLLFLGIPARRRSWQTMLGVLVLMAALGSLAGCGGGSSGGGGGGGTSDPGTSAGTYTFSIQATGTPSVSPAVSTTFTVTVN